MNYAQILLNILSYSEARIRLIKDGTFHARPKVGAWAPKEILGHLIDSAYNNHQRFLRAQKQDHLVFQGYDQNEWVIMNRYLYRGREDIIQTWMTANRHLANLLDAIPEKVMEEEHSMHNFSRIGWNKVPADQPATLSHLVWDYIHHMEHHLSQLIEGYEKHLQASA
ncbi:MAG: DinB family protein [Bacteroidota bacterium]